MGATNLPEDLGIVLVDHGSKREEANAMLFEVAALLRESSGARIVEPAHMELAAPGIREAFAACVARGAKRVVVQPYFLAPGRHSTTDIPELTAAAAREFPDVPFTVAEPLGVDPRMAEIVLKRIQESL